MECGRDQCAQRRCESGPTLPAAGRHPMAALHRRGASRHCERPVDANCSSASFGTAGEPLTKWSISSCSFVSVSSSETCRCIRHHRDTCSANCSSASSRASSAASSSAFNRAVEIAAQQAIQFGVFGHLLRPCWRAAVGCSRTTPRGCDAASPTHRRATCRSGWRCRPRGHSRGNAFRALRDVGPSRAPGSVRSAARRSSASCSTRSKRFAQATQGRLT